MNPEFIKGAVQGMSHPQHEKLMANRERADTIGEVWDWLEAQGYIISELRCVHGFSPEECEESRSCRSGKNEQVYWPTRLTPQELVAEIIGIDRNALEEEKRAMLEDLRSLHRLEEQ